MKVEKEYLYAHGSALVMLSALVRQECKEVSDFFSLSFSRFSNNVAAKTILSLLPHFACGRKTPTGFSWYTVAVDF